MKKILLLCLLLTSCNNTSNVKPIRNDGGETVEIRCSNPDNVSEECLTWRVEQELLTKK